ncbi:hypothetical protein JOD43_001571 [Pullulanibacillus pueri]|uniref:FbpB family small basic protein n=1 Tax=Pullulanibacillus pueri TaxID=1437324 RepID=A0A8J3EKX3_9BACL|nr:FbpB family small basic protein [Pullulanibacillus pueri]MBM7681404.1 hypothetical protein [Pullulanibacillus pueri]GGH78746.1 hypothetical protein GCM10007096_12640 [Pullulanibacillus pueri]
MRKKTSFKELVVKNRSEIINNQQLLEKIEEKIDKKHNLKLSQ